jgi:hypothetical protein
MMPTVGFGNDQKHLCFWQRMAVVVLVATGLLAWAPQVRANAYPTPTPSSAPVCHDGAPATVSIDAGTVTNTTTLDLSADGGTSIGDSSGGDDNLATTGDGEKKDDHGKGNGKGKNNKHDDASEEDAAAGNGGVSDAGADGGAIAVENVNSGGNVGSAIAVGDTWGAGYDACGNPIAAVSIVGGTVTNETIISVSADGGTAIADASGGDHNIASAGGRAGNGGTITSSAGNGGVSTASADGGAISIGDINSGGNAGNAIGVGDTVAGPVPICCNVPPLRPIPSKPAPGPAPDVVPGKVVVVMLPSTGSGMALAGGAVAATMLALATSAASVATRRRMV